MQQSKTAVSAAVVAELRKFARFNAQLGAAFIRAFDGIGRRWNSLRRVVINARRGRSGSRGTVEVILSDKDGQILATTSVPAGVRVERSEKNLLVFERAPKAEDGEGGGE